MPTMRRREVWSSHRPGFDGLPATHYESGRRAQGDLLSSVGLKFDDTLQHQPCAAGKEDKPQVTETLLG